MLHNSCKTTREIYRQVHTKMSVYFKINILRVLKILSFFRKYISYFPKCNVHPELPIVEEQLQPNIDWVSSRTLINSLREDGKSFIFIFCVRALIAEGLCDLQSSRISPMSIRSWQLWNLFLVPNLLEICFDVFFLW